MPQLVWGLDCSVADIELTSQEAVDNFQATYGGGGVCDTVTGSLTVRGDDSQQSSGDITDISGLLNLTEVGGDLRIRTNAILTNLDGLANLTSVGGNLDFSRNPKLTNIDGLTKLTGMVGELSFYQNHSLIEINGLANVTNVQSLYITDNNVLTNIDGLVNLSGGVVNLYIEQNRALTNIDGLASLASVDWQVRLSLNSALININGLANLTSVGSGLSIEYNDALANIDGLANLTSLEGGLRIIGNNVLTNIDGLANLTSLDNNLNITDNASLANLDGLSSLTSVDSSLSVQDNDSLAQCAGLFRVLDEWDDAEPGPGPGIGGVPDVGSAVNLRGNLAGCNSIQEILSGVNTSRINAGLNDAWLDLETDGQGFFITVYPDLGVVTLAWFTYDTEFPADDVQANLGDAGHRWFTGLGWIENNQVVMEIEMTSGGLFDTATEIQRTDPPGSDGTIVLTFDSCNSGTVEYDIPSINMQGTVPIERVAKDNVALCEALSVN
jgi:hypothetical protein